METTEALRAFISGKPLPEHGPLTSQSRALYVDEWWPAAVRITPGNFLVRINDEGPMPEISSQLSELLLSEGLQNLGDENDWPLVEGITLQWLGVVGAAWNVWSNSPAEAGAAIDAKVMDDDPTPKTI